jgi:hypothetical protein
MKRSILVSVLIILVVSTSVYASDVTNNSTENKIFMMSTQEASISTPADYPAWAEIYNAKEVKLFYRSINDSEFKSVNMSPIENYSFIYEGIIPEDEFKSGKVEYFVEANFLDGKYLKGPVFTVKVEPLTIDDDYSVMATGDHFYDIQYYNGKLPNGVTIPSTYISGIKSPIRSSDVNTSIYPPVTSKMMEVRSVSPNPHNGIDLSTSANVYAALPGKVTYSGGSYGIVEIGHDVNSDGVMDFYSRYVHMSNIKVNLGDTVQQTTQIGTASNVGTTAVHLDFSFFVKDNQQNKRFMPGKYFYNSVTSWNTGLDLDFAQPPKMNYDYQTRTHNITVNAYKKGGDSSNVVSATISYRISGTTTWTHASMTKVTGTNDFKYTFPTTYTNKNIEYYITFGASGISGTVTRPMERGLEGPTKDGPPSIYYYTSLVEPLSNPTSDNNNN